MFKNDVFVYQIFVLDLIYFSYFFTEKMCVCDSAVNCRSGEIIKYMEVRTMTDRHHRIRIKH